MEYLKEQKSNDKNKSDDDTTTSTTMIRNNNEKANQFMEILFQEYLEKGTNINSVDTLVALATQNGIHDNADQLRAILTDDSDDQTYIRQVHEKDALAKRQMRVSGVPFFIVESNHPSAGKRPPTAFSGAQPADVIAEVLQEAAAVDDDDEDA